HSSVPVSPSLNRLHVPSPNSRPWSPPPHFGPEFQSGASTTPERGQRNAVLFTPPLSESVPSQCGTPPSFVVFRTRIGPAYFFGSAFATSLSLAFFPVFLVDLFAMPITLRALFANVKNFSRVR